MLQTVIAEVGEIPTGRGDSNVNQTLSYINMDIRGDKGMGESETPPGPSKPFLFFSSTTTTTITALPRHLNRTAGKKQLLFSSVSRSLLAAVQSSQRIAPFALQKPKRAHSFSFVYIDQSRARPSVSPKPQPCIASLAAPRPLHGLPQQIGTLSVREADPSNLNLLLGPPPVESTLSSVYNKYSTPSLPPALSPRPRTECRPSLHSLSLSSVSPYLQPLAAVIFATSVGSTRTGSYTQPFLTSFDRKRESAAVKSAPLSSNDLHEQQNCQLLSHIRGFECRRIQREDSEEFSREIRIQNSGGRVVKHHEIIKLYLVCANQINPFLFSALLL
ncbi:unnamed protein product [Bursaphelenchus okinawaensis]|uniref:Uncharacterized protein n=1 Tax=Bursaphelenchus okinawaensis TaxID=465554 RepID=A0A811L8X4_9BILA|nr:unnamed protein product [Bursaphelenchus okinawaensis]CAG9120182.1 unnamed protein product [Bursaphelenchus okinawaensis]